MLCRTHGKSTWAGFLKGHFHESQLLEQPWQWEAEAAGEGKAFRIFCGSLMDINDRKADAWREELWPIIEMTPHLVYMVLSKIPERYVETLPDDWGNGYPNVWLGAST